MKNKIICLLLAVIMCFACLAGCNGGGDGGDDKKDDTVNNNNNNNNNDDNNDDNNDNPGGGTTDDTEWWENITYDEASLIFQMTHCTNNQELPSGCERYLAGQLENGDPAGNERVDELVRKRNADAYENTKVNVKYVYYADNYDKYGYSFARNEISATIKNSSDENRPDIFCNWMTDMLLCSLKGDFANVFTQNTADYGHNYFDIELSLTENSNQYGYMTELMRSLTLNKSQVYVIASDYFIDLIRAFFVVPVNVNLFNQAINSGKLQPALADINEDGTTDIDDFFAEVNAGKWTYDRLIQYSTAITTAGDTDTIHDVLGFALGQNGLPAAGMIYTSSAKVIKRETKDGVTTYAYPDDPDASFKAVIEGIEKMVQSKGIMMMTKDDAKALQVPKTEETALLGIRHKFINNTLLFGGVILVGSLEFEAYDKMSEDGGFAVVPVPVFKEGEEYLTQIHVVGRAGAITNNTKKFSQCSAFIQYQTKNSTKVLDYYYEYNLSTGRAGGIAGNVEMLAYIRDNVRTSFDKLFEDAIGFFYTVGISEADRYHTLLTTYNYEFKDEFTGKYSETITTKKTNLSNLEKEYANLPK